MGKNELSAKINYKLSPPAYMRAIYSWYYSKEKLVPFFDNKIFMNITSFFYRNKLIDELLKDIKIGSNVLQAGATYSDQITKLAEKIGETGNLTILDICPTQVRRWHKKLIAYNNANIVHKDIESKLAKKYDAVICFMLLHELPDAKKSRAINNLLKSLDEKGKLIIIDYHNPANNNPLKYIIRPINRLFEPFAEALWKKTIKDFVINQDNYRIRTQIYLGGIYQKTIIYKKV